MSKMYQLHINLCKNSEVDIAVIKYKLSKDPECLERISTTDDYPHPEPTMTAYLHAAFYAHDKCLEFLVSSGANTNKTLPGGIDALELCLCKGDSSIVNAVEYLVKNGLFGMDNSRNKFLNDYIFYTINTTKRKPVINALRILIKYGAKVHDYKTIKLELKSYIVQSPTVRAVIGCYPDVLKLLLLNNGIVDHRQSGFSIEELNQEAKNCLSLIHWFAIYAYDGLDNTLETLNVLYEFGANLWEKNMLGLIPIEVCTCSDATLKEIKKKNGETLHDGDGQRPKENKMITKKLIELINKPLSLKSLCRITLLNAKRDVNYVEYVNTLLISSDVKDLLLFKDLDKKLS